MPTGTSRNAPNALTSYIPKAENQHMMATKVICKRCSAPLYLEVDGETCFGCDRSITTTIASIERFLRGKR